MSCTWALCPGGLATLAAQQISVFELDFPAAQAGGFRQTLSRRSSAQA